MVSFRLCFALMVAGSLTSNKQSIPYKYYVFFDLNADLVTAVLSIS